MCSYNTWDQSPLFKLTCQAVSLCNTAVRAYITLVDDLLNEGFQTMMTSRLQNDPIDLRFTQYREIIGSKFHLGW